MVIKCKMDRFADICRLQPLPNKKEKGCELKKRFKTKQKVLNWIKHKRKTGLIIRQNPYKCNYCNGWHLTSGQVWDAE